MATHDTLPRFSTAMTHSWMKRGTVPCSRSHSSNSDEPKTMSATNGRCLVPHFIINKSNKKIK